MNSLDDSETRGGYGDDGGGKPFEATVMREKLQVDDDDDDSFPFDRLPLDLMLHIVSYLPEPSYNVVMTVKPSEKRYSPLTGAWEEDEDDDEDEEEDEEDENGEDDDDDDDDDDDALAGVVCGATDTEVLEDKLLYRSFDDEIEAMTDIYRLNSYPTYTGACICCHSHGVLQSLEKLVLEEEESVRGNTDPREPLSESVRQTIRLAVLRREIAAIETSVSEGQRKAGSGNLFELDIVHGTFEKRGLEWLKWIYHED